MRAKMIFAALISITIWTAPLLAVEHGGMEHGGIKMDEPSAGDIRNAMKDHVDKETKEKGFFEVYDPETGMTRKLELVRIHERVGKTGNYYYSCADFKDTGTSEMLDLDIDVRSENGKLTVADTRIHKVGGKERYTYDAHDNRIPIKK